MTAFLTFAEAKNWIENIHRFGDKLDLSRMRRACELLGHPEQSFKSIHVAGTNGKGSTANFIKNILSDAGYKTGIYTSPYVVFFNERIGIDDYYISDERLLDYANFIRGFWEEYQKQYGEVITFFEVLTLIAFLYYRDEKVDYAVFEAGLGGLLDATNVIVPEVACITNISFDHMKQLGSTLESIAINKLGIVKEGVPLVSSIENKHLFPLFYSETAKKKAELKIIDFTKVDHVSVKQRTTFRYCSETYELRLLGYHQVKNATLAIEVVRTLKQRKRLPISEENIKNGLLRTSWPGRFEIFEDKIVLDGAHNIGGIESLRKTLASVYPDQRVICLFCMMADKEHEKAISELDNFVDEFHFTEIDYPRRANAVDLFNESHHPSKYIEVDFKQAFYRLREKLDKNEILLITGSLYFVSEIRRLIVGEW
ncbi:MAG: bifunctional folylpolyglutamate synthase/dihydrofolate synthase [Candidatus Izemoplasmatales bacterium]|jgi:dihydrofolate synthase/folylpolyglutamate synthase